MGKIALMMIETCMCACVRSFLEIIPNCHDMSLWDSKFILKCCNMCVKILLNYHKIKWEKNILSPWLVENWIVSS